jgi:hypothetical protein
VPALWGYTFSDPSPSGNTVAFTSFSLTGPSPAPIITTSNVVILNSADNIVSSSGSGLPATISRTFAYGESNESILSGLTAAIRAAAEEPQLNVIYL